MKNCSKLSMTLGWLAPSSVMRVHTRLMEGNNFGTRPESMLHKTSRVEIASIKHCQERKRNSYITGGGELVTYRKGSRLLLDSLVYETAVIMHCQMMYCHIFSKFCKHNHFWTWKLFFNDLRYSYWAISHDLKKGFLSGGDSLHPPLPPKK